MLAIESSLTGCGSDDWSVDSDYAFQDFTEDDGETSSRYSNCPQASPKQGQQQLTVRAVAQDDATVGTRTGKEISEELGGVTVDNNTGVLSGSNTPGRATSDGASVRGIQREASRKLAELEPVGSSVDRGTASDHDGLVGDLRDMDGSPTREDSRHQFGDPGSSTENMHILRVEQRMFLKVRIVVFARENPRVVQSLRCPRLPFITGVSSYVGAAWTP